MLLGVIRGISDAVKSDSGPRKDSESEAFELLFRPMRQAKGSVVDSLAQVRAVISGAGTEPAKSEPAETGEIIVAMCHGSSIDLGSPKAVAATANEIKVVQKGQSWSVTKKGARRAYRVFDSKSRGEGVRDG